MPGFAFAALIMMSVCTAFAEGNDPSGDAVTKSQALAAVSNALVETRTLPAPELRDILVRSRDETPNLQAMIRSTAPRIWVSERMCDPVLRSLWASLGVSEIPRDLPAGYAARVPEKQATACFRQLAAFARLSEIGDQAVWAFLVERARHEPTVCDLCVFGWLVWGQRFGFLPSSDRSVIRFDDQPLARGNWVLPSTSNENWRALFSGTNGVYRLLAVKAMDAWAKDDAIEDVLRKALGDEFVAVRHEALARVDGLPPDRQVEVLQDSLKWLKRQAVGSDEEEEGQRWFSDDMTRRLRRAEEQKERVLHQKHPAREGPNTLTPSTNGSN